MKKLSIVVIFYNMQREAKRTLFSLSAKYQNINKELYSVYAVDNGSLEPLDREFVESFGSNFHYIYYNTTSKSPVEAINSTIKEINTPYIACMIDGARIASPNIINYSLDMLNLHKDPIVYTIGMHIGPDVQNISITKGYNKTVEDKLLESINWQENGYNLFNISSLALSSKEGFFSIPSEANYFAMKKDSFINIGGYNEKFQYAGGGLCNLEFFKRASTTYTPICLLGEATFHQIHGGVATNAPMDKHPYKIMHKEYIDIVGDSYTIPEIKPLYYGKYRKI